MAHSSRRLDGYLTKRNGKTYTRFRVGKDVIPSVEELIKSLGGKLIQEAKQSVAYEVPGNHLTILIGSVRGWLHNDKRPRPEKENEQEVLECSNG